MVRLLLLMLLCSATTAAAQSTDAPHAALSPETLGFTYDEAFLRDLPLSDSLYPLLETVQPSLISDRFTNGGLFLARPARVGGFQASWSQTRFLVGDVDLSDPTGTGLPLLTPDLSAWQRIRIATGLIGSDVNSTGLAVSLDPRRPSAAWQHTGFGSLSHGPLTARPSSLEQPTIARVNARDRLSWSGRGPISDRLGAALALSWTRTSQFDRDDDLAGTTTLGSLVASFVHTSATGAQLHTIGWFQRARAPLEYRRAFSQPEATTADTGVHVQTTWSADPSRRWPLRVFAAYTQRRLTPDVSSPTAIVDRLVDGPVWAAVNTPRGTVRQWTIGTRVARATSWRSLTHALSGGADVVGAAQRTPPSSVRTVGELTDGLASRVWSFRNPEVSSSRHSLTMSAHVTDTVRLSSRLTASVGARFEVTGGSADAALGDITWISLLPRGRIDWRLRPAGTSVAFIGYTRSASRLALDLLSFGDPAAPWAAVYRWDPRFAQPTPGVTSIVARVGPGSAGTADFVRIDPNLRRPTSDELAFGVELRPSDRARMQLAAVGRREQAFMTLVNTGAPAAAYATTWVADPGANTGRAEDDKVIPVYDRLTGTFGSDQYVLTNPGLKAAYSGSLELSGQYSANRLMFAGGATASIARGPSAALGYGPLENDQSVVTETYVSPNSDPFRRGRLFNDRAFTIKLSAVYRLPWEMRVGAIARYQDGQNFSRVLVFPDLAQGTEAVRAFAAGDSRFRFIATLDTRLSKALAVSGRQVDVILDGYNVTGQRYDVEERAAQAPDVRTPIAIQPSRVIHVGIRIGW